MVDWVFMVIPKVTCGRVVFYVQNPLIQKSPPAAFVQIFIFMNNKKKKKMKIDYDDDGGFFFSFFFFS